MNKKYTSRLSGEERAYAVELLNGAKTASKHSGH